MSEEHTPYTVEMVVGHNPKWKKLKKGNVLANRNDIKRMGHYETKWLGYENSENTWEEGKKLEKTVAFTIERYWNKLKEEDTVYANIQSNRTSRTSSVTSEKLKSPKSNTLEKQAISDETVRVEKPQNNNVLPKKTEKSPKVDSPAVPDKSSLEQIDPKIIAPGTMSKTVPVENYEMPIIESLVETEPSKPSESPESSTPSINMSPPINIPTTKSTSNTNQIMINSTDFSSLDITSSQKSARHVFHELNTKKATRKSLQRKIVFNVTKPSGKLIDGSDKKSVHLENLKITKFGDFLPEGKKNSEKKSKYTRMGFVVSYKDGRNGDLFLPIEVKKTKDAEKDEQLREKLLVLQHCLKGKIKEFLETLPKMAE